MLAKLKERNSTKVTSFSCAPLHTAYKDLSCLFDVNHRISRALSKKGQMISTKAKKTQVD